MAGRLRADHPGESAVLIPIPQGRLRLGGCGDLLGWPYFSYVWVETLATRSLRRSLRFFSSRLTVQAYQPSKRLIGFQRGVMVLSRFQLGLPA
jgi:hypothetical protein